MAWTSLGTLGAGNDTKTSANTLTLTTTAATSAGDVVVVVIAKDNTTTTDGDNNEVTSISDSAGGNTWTKARERTNSQAAAAAGATGSIWFSKLTNAIASGGTITANFSANSTADAMSAWKFSITFGNVVSVESGVDGTPEDATTVPVATISGLTSQQYLFVAVTAVEGPSGDAFTQDADYTTMTRSGTTGAAAASNMTVNGAFRIFTGTGDTYAPTLGTARDLAQPFVALKEAAPPSGPPGGQRTLALTGVGI